MIKVEIDGDFTHSQSFARKLTKVLTFTLPKYRPEISKLVILICHLPNPIDFPIISPRFKLMDLTVLSVVELCSKLKLTVTFLIPKASQES